jgi:hypothetical protein
VRSEVVGGGRFIGVGEYDRTAGDGAAKCDPSTRYTMHDSRGAGAFDDASLNTGLSPGPPGGATSASSPAGSDSVRARPARRRPPPAHPGAASAGTFACRRSRRSPPSRAWPPGPPRGWRCRRAARTWPPRAASGSVGGCRPRVRSHCRFINRAPNMLDTLV